MLCLLNSLTMAQHLDCKKLSLVCRKLCSTCASCFSQFHVNWLRIVSVYLKASFNWLRSYISFVIHISWWLQLRLMFRQQMFGPVEWHFMLCWWAHTLLKTHRILRTSERRLLYAYSINFSTSTQVTHFLYLLKWETPSWFILQRIMAVQYKIPEYVRISQDCRHLLSQIFTTNPARVCLSLEFLCDFTSWVCMDVGCYWNTRFYEYAFFFIYSSIRFFFLVDR